MIWLNRNYINRTATSLSWLRTMMVINGEEFTECWKKSEHPKIQSYNLQFKSKNIDLMNIKFYRQICHINISIQINGGNIWPWNYRLIKQFWIHQQSVCPFTLTHKIWVWFIRNFTNRTVTSMSQLIWMLGIVGQKIKVIKKFKIFTILSVHFYDNF